MKIHSLKTLRHVLLDDIVDRFVSAELSWREFLERVCAATTDYDERLAALEFARVEIQRCEIEVSK